MIGEKDGVARVDTERNRNSCGVAVSRMAVNKWLLTSTSKREKIFFLGAGHTHLAHTVNTNPTIPSKGFGNSHGDYVTIMKEPPVTENKGNKNSRVHTHLLKRCKIIFCYNIQTRKGH